VFDWLKARREVERASRVKVLVRDELLGKDDLDPLPIFAEGRGWLIAMISERTEARIELDRDECTREFAVAALDLLVVEALAN
jgi:hypothetical protein